MMLAPDDSLWGPMLSRLITCEADKTIKVWKEDPDATPETHPIDMEEWTREVRRHKRY